MDRPTTPEQALSVCRQLAAAVAHAAEIPDEWRPLIGGARLLPEGTDLTNAEGKRRRIRTVRKPPPWDSTRDGIPWETLAEWESPPLLLSSTEDNRLGRPALTYAATADDPAFSYVARRPASFGDRPRVVVWGGPGVAATPHGTHRQATAALVARQAADAVDAYADDLTRATTAAEYRREARAYRAFSDRAAADIPKTTDWVTDPFIETLFADHETWARTGTTTGTRPPATAATPRGFGYAVAAPTDNDTRRRRVN